MQLRFFVVLPCHIYLWIMRGKYILYIYIYIANMQMRDLWYEKKENKHT